MKKTVLICLRILLIHAFLILPFHPKTYAGSDYYPGDDWRTSTPEEQRIDSEKLVQMLKYIKEKSIDHPQWLLVLQSYVAKYHS
jgi:hypothetical protein